jgi:hypothetical protein
MACLYGPSGQIVKTQSCGSNIRIGANPGNVMWGGFVGIRYCESCTFNTVLATRNATQFYAGSAPAGTVPTTDNDVDISLALNTGDVYTGEGFIGVTWAGPEGGWLYRRKRFVDQAGTETLDFGNPRTFDHPVYRAAAADTATFSLKAATATNVRQYFGLDCAQLTVIGRGNNGQLTGALTFNVPTVAYSGCTTTSGSAVVTMASTAGLFATMPITGTGIPGATTILSVDSTTQITLSANATASGTVTLTVTSSINGAFTNLVYAANSFNRPVTVAIYYDGSNRWTIKADNALSSTATYDPPSLATAASSPIQTMTVTGAIVGDGVNMSFSNSLAGARLTGWVSAANTVSYYFTNEAGANPLDLASGTVTARIIR